MDQTAKFGWKRWLEVILIGFVGQLAWAVENQYINSWIYSQTHSATYITWTTIASAIAATITTLFMGVLSDRLGKRKIFIAGGYVIWGVTVFLFGVMSRHNMEGLAGVTNSFLLAGIMNIIVDCVMTFFGSTSNDACFNAHVTEITNEHNRPKVEAILSVLPLFAVAAMLGIGGLLGVPTTQGKNEDTTAFADRSAQPWFIFFLVFGAIVTVIGIVAFFIIPKDQIVPNRERSYMKNIVYGFRPSTIKKTPLFYITLLAFMFFNIATDSFMPYYIVYFTNSVDQGGVALGDNYLLAMIIIMGIASLLVIVLGFFMDKIGKLKLLIPGVVLMAVGAVILFCFTDLVWCIVGGTFLMSGYLIGTAVLGAELRDQTPDQDVGLFQGVRMVGAVLLPMIIGSYASLATFQHKYEEFGETKSAPDKWMFLVTIGACLLALIPAIWLIIKIQKSKVVDDVKVTDSSEKK
jgi:MFS family permease